MPIMICSIDTETGEVRLGDRVVAHCSTGHCILRGFVVDDTGRVTTAGIVDYDSSHPGVTLENVTYAPGQTSACGDEHALERKLGQMECLAREIRELVGKKGS